MGVLGTMGHTLRDPGLFIHLFIDTKVVSSFHVSFHSYKMHCWIIIFWETAKLFSKVHFTLSPAMHESSSCFTRFSVFLVVAILLVYSGILVIIRISLMTDHDGHFLMHLLAIQISSFVKHLSRLLPLFKMLSFYYWVVRVLYIFWI